MNDQTLKLWRQIEHARRWGKKRQMPILSERPAAETADA
jgi:hypothetical protein